MIVWRAVQSFIGGGMIPCSLPPSSSSAFQARRDLGQIGLVATLAPAIGPTVGGYLTDSLS